MKLPLDPSAVFGLVRELRDSTKKEKPIVLGGAPALVDALRREGIVTSERAGNLRISAHAYNSTEDVDAVLAALVRHRRLLA